MINKALFTSKTDNWATPQVFFDKLNEEFNFTLDPCATKENAKCKKYYTKEDDGLSKEWRNEIVFCNPPLW
jgi:site-specific DNA-methyltransferase (adenine-specific)